MPESAELVKVADAITAELAVAQQGGRFVDLEAFTPQRSWADWKEDLDELDSLRVDVVGLSYDECELDTRKSVSYTCTTHVGVRRWFPNSQVQTGGRINREKIDRLVYFIQELNEFFCDEAGRRLATYPDAVWQATKILTTFNRKYLRDKRMFFGLLKVTYEASVDL
jgi:hypothetical protein